MSGKQFYVFSYGSNLLFERISERIDSVKLVSTYNMPCYRLVFNKASEDGSVKANIEESNNPKDSVWGVIHKLDYKEKFILDWHETLGYGYQLICFKVEIGGKLETVHTYMVNESRYKEVGKPYSWYLKFVVAGAIQNHFPQNYISGLLDLDSEKDMNLSRSSENEMILQLAR